ncbi:MAG: hypothetical protein KAR20_24565, partial [Candidatus Heimdallarchaeota archaeon]|nr:hypothetical protein [Candidatus Heimdallarchaeota archaeon]
HLTVLLSQKKRAFTRSDHNYPKIILFLMENQNCGLLVDNIVQIIQISSDDLKPTLKSETSNQFGHMSPYIFEFKGDLVSYLDIENVVTKFTASLTSLQSLPLNSHSSDVFHRVKFQRDYIIPEIDKKLFSISDAELDLFRELGNFGGGNAGSYLSELIGVRVFLEIPPVRIVAFSDLQDIFSGLSVIRQTGKIGPISGNIGAVFAFIIQETHTNLLYGTYLNYQKGEKFLPSQGSINSQKDFISKLLNNLCEKYLQSISSFLEISPLPHIAENISGFGSTILSKVTTSFPIERNKIMLIETRFSVENPKPLVGRFYFFLSSKNVHAVLQLLSDYW